MGRLPGGIIDAFRETIHRDVIVHPTSRRGEKPAGRRECENVARKRDRERERRGKRRGKDPTGINSRTTEAQKMYFASTGTPTIRMGTAASGQTGM